MMFGGMFMMGFGLIAILLVIAVPAAFIAVLIWALTRRGNPSVASATIATQTISSSSHTCSHCAGD